MNSDRRMKILVVGQTPPWPEITGARMRLANIVRGLQRLGDVDVFILVDPDSGAPDLARPLAGIRLEVASRSRWHLSPLERLRWLARGQMPLALTGRDDSDLQARFANWAQRSYDLVWFSRPETCVALGTLVRGPAIVDLDDLEDRKIEGRLSVVGPVVRGAMAPMAGRWISRLHGTRDAQLWRRLYRRIAGSVDAVAVCSEADRRHLGVPNAVVIPNGYAFQARPLGRDTIGDPPVIAFPGFLRYAPNRDAAQYLVGSIAPLIRARLPGVQIRLVGDAGDEIPRLHRPPHVVVTGHVQAIEEELARADVIAVPIRYGGGTRIKILEAFAHRIPAVSTSVGAEGIDVIPGRHLLVADTPETFAAALVRVLTEPGLRRALVDAAQQLFVQRYRWDHIHAQIASVGAGISTRGAQPVHA